MVLNQNPIKLLVGLGNPGDEYAETRHNAGAWFVNELANHHNVSLRFENKFSGLFGSLNYQGTECKLLLPATYMNKSGQSVLACANFYKIPLSSILAAHDELDFTPGIVRLKFGGGHGGHNGLRDIAARCGGSDFYRLRIGIGHPGNKDLVSGYVLSKPSRDDKNKITNSIENAGAILPELLRGDIEKAMNILHDDKNM